MSTAVPLDNTYADGDVDFTTSSAIVTGRVPAIPGFAGQVIVVGADAYLRHENGTTYEHIASTDLLLNPGDPNGAAAVILGALQLASDSRTQPRLVGVESCPEGGCYHVTVSISRDVVNEKLGDAGSAVGQGVIDLWILENGFHLARLEFTSTDPTAGALKARLELSRYDRGVSIKAPPAAQIVGG